MNQEKLTRLQNQVRIGGKVRAKIFMHCLINQRQFSMAYTLIDRKITS